MQTCKFRWEETLLHYCRELKTNFTCDQKIIVDISVISSCVLNTIVDCRINKLGHVRVAENFLFNYFDSHKFVEIVYLK